METFLKDRDVAAPAADPATTKDATNGTFVAGRILIVSLARAETLNPRRVALLILPIQYLRSKNALATFMGSMKVPPSVKETIQAFDKAVQENTSLFQNTLDTMLQESDKNILEAETDGSPYFGAVNARFAEKFIQLKPKADEIIASMRKFLKIE